MIIIWASVNSVNKLLDVTTELWKFAYFLKCITIVHTKFHVGCRNGNIFCTKSTHYYVYQIWGKISKLNKQIALNNNEMFILFLQTLTNIRQFQKNVIYILSNCYTIDPGNFFFFFTLFFIQTNKISGNKSNMLLGMILWCDYYYFFFFVTYVLQLKQRKWNNGNSAVKLVKIASCFFFVCLFSFFLYTVILICFHHAIPRDVFVCK